MSKINKEFLMDCGFFHDGENFIYGEMEYRGIIVKFDDSNIFISGRFMEVYSNGRQSIKNDKVAFFKFLLKLHYDNGANDEKARMRALLNI